MALSLVPSPSADPPAPAPAPAEPAMVYRRTVTICILPKEHKGLHEELLRAVRDLPDVRVVVDRRAKDGADRRAAGAGHGGEERRVVERRDPSGPTSTVAELGGVKLSRGLRRHADEIVCVERELPVHRADADAAATSLLFDAVGGDRAAQHELRLRFHQEVHGRVRAEVPRRKATETTEAVFRALFAQQSPPPFRPALADAYAEVLGG